MNDINTAEIPQQTNALVIATNRIAILENELIYARQVFADHTTRLERNSTARATEYSQLSQRYSEVKESERDLQQLVKSHAATIAMLRAELATKRRLRTVRRTRQKPTRHDVQSAELPIYML